MADTQKYTVGWICALPTEAVAAATFLDDEHDDVPEVALHDNNSYTLGSIGGHNVVIAVLPDGEYGLVSAATVARDMLHSFPNIRVSVMVGIGGGAPSPDHDIRLGDVVVSSRGGGKGGVMQYDFGKAVQGLPFEHTDFLDQPPAALRTAVSALKVQHERKGHQLHRHVESKLAENPRFRQKYSRPTGDTDVLYRADFVHPDPSKMCGSVCGNESTRLVSRNERADEEDESLIHYGLIASGNQLIKDASMRDRLASQMDVLCFEMEAAGLMNHWPCLVIRGICDYSDSHKNKQWQGFAAMMAAAYARDLLHRVSPKKVEAEGRIKDTLEKCWDVLLLISRTVEETHRVVSTLTSDKSLDGLKKWLLPASFSINITAARAHRHPGTGAWFIEGNVFQQWKARRLPHLWLHGLPGCGKTVLSVKIHDHLQRITTSTLVSFFFDFNDSEKQDFGSLVRTVAFQLCQSGPKAMEEMESLFKVHEEGRSSPSINALEGCITSMVLACGHVVILLDALDECTSRQHVLEWIDRMASSIGTDHLQFLVTGRPERDLEWALSRGFGQAGCIRLDHDAIDADIRSFVTASLESHHGFAGKDLSPDLKQEIGQKLGNEADGMFRWAACQVEALAECLNPYTMWKALERLPRTLDETYQRMIDRIPKEHEDDAVRLLQFVIRTKRPLDAAEVMDILAIQTKGEQRDYNPECRPFHPGYIIQYCPGLITIIEEKVRLAHFSVKEFLIKKDHFDIKPSSITIARHSLTYLTNADFTADSKREDYPLLDYAATLWMDYAHDSEDLLQDVLSFFKNTRALRHWQRVYQYAGHTDLGTRDISTEGPPLPFICRGGLLWVAKVLLDNGADVNAKGSMFDNALQAASYGGHLEVVKYLLDRGAEICEETGHFGSALQAASHEGHYEICQILLDHGAKPNSGGPWTGDSISNACLKNHPKVVQLLLASGASINGQNMLVNSPLHVASALGHQEIVQILLDSGADLEAKTNPQAEFMAFKEVLREVINPEILERGLEEVGLAEPSEDLEAQTILFGLYTAKPEHGDKNTGVTPLQSAASKDQARIVQLLLDRGADVNAKGGEHGSSLQAAIAGRHRRTLSLLIKRGADVNIQSGKYGNALQYASQLGSLDVVLFLLQNGAQVNAQGGKYGSALQAASAKGFMHIVRILLRNGANRDIRGGRFGSALEAALSKGHQDIVNLLLGSQTESVVAERTEPSEPV